MLKKKQGINFLFRIVRAVMIEIFWSVFPDFSEIKISQENGSCRHDVLFLRMCSSEIDS